jgi:hypothetical protein
VVAGVVAVAVLLFLLTGRTLGDALLGSLGPALGAAMGGAYMRLGARRDLRRSG